MLRVESARMFVLLNLYQDKMLSKFAIFLGLYYSIPKVECPKFLQVQVPKKVYGNTLSAPMHRVVEGLPRRSSDGGVHHDKDSRNGSETGSDESMVRDWYAYSKIHQ